MVGLHDTSPRAVFVVRIEGAGKVKGEEYILSEALECHLFSCMQCRSVQQTGALRADYFMLFTIQLYSWFYYNNSINSYKLSLKP